MRAAITLLAILIIVGCKKKEEFGGSVPSEVSSQKASEENKSVAVVLPVATSNLRVTDGSLYSFYDPAHDGTYKKHSHEGKRILLKTDGIVCWGIEDKRGQHLEVVGSNRGFQRPYLAIALRPASKFVKGDYPLGPCYFEGRLVGPTRFEDKEWAKDWLSLSDQGTHLKTSFILIDDAFATAEPRD